MARGRRLTGVLAALVLLPLISPAGVSPAARAITPAPAGARVTLGPSSVHWTGCASIALADYGAQCATVRVPLDYGHPHGATISLAIARVRHTVPATAFQGVMLTNPGGPGAPGRALVSLAFAVPHDAGLAYDWIGIDPRGVGASRPALSCDNGYARFGRPKYNPARPADLAAWQLRTTRYATACAARNGALLAHMTTADSARDLDQVRKALGAAQVNYYGFSYGTYLGQVYATMFPSRVRRMVLDSNVNPARVWYSANLDQDVAFQRDIDAWFAWTARFDTSFHLGRTAKAVAARWYAVRSALSARPDHGLGPDEWTDAFIDAAYSQQAWSELAWIFSGYVRHHDVTSVKQQYASSSGLGSDNQYAVYTAVQCTDVAWPRAWSTWLRDNTRVNRAAPFETWSNAWFNAPCRVWPVAARTPVRVDGRRIGGILLIGETGDGATPFAGNLEVRTRFPHARLIALPGGTSHANSLNGDGCLDNRIAAYLATGSLPARLTGTRADLSCRPLPQPRP